MILASAWLEASTTSGGPGDLGMLPTPFRGAPKEAAVANSGKFEGENTTATRRGTGGIPSAPSQNKPPPWTKAPEGFKPGDTPSLFLLKTPGGTERGLLSRGSIFNSLLKNPQNVRTPEG